MRNSKPKKKKPLANLNMCFSFPFSFPKFRTVPASHASQGGGGSISELHEA
jgi:hypothetical protein